MARRPQFRQSTISGPATGYRPPGRPFEWVKLPWPLIGAILILIGLGWFLFVSDRFTVRSISITGSVNDGVNQALNELKGKNILILSPSTLEQDLPHRQSSIAALHIIKGFPDTLRVDIAVRQPLVRWKSGDQELYLDQSGVVFSLDPKPSTEVVDRLPAVNDPRSQPVELGRVLVPPTFVKFVTTLHETFRERSGAELANLSVSETTRELAATTGNQLTVRFDTTRTLDPQLSTLATVMSTYGSSIRESIDLRVPGRVFYK